MPVIPFLSLIRVGNCCLAAAAVWVGAFMTAGYQLTLELGAVMAGTFLICAGGNAGNDVLDVEADRVNHPRRPLPSGRISMRTASILATGCTLSALPLMLLTNIYVTSIGLATILLVFAYNRRIKRWGLVGNLLIAAISASTFVSGGLTVSTTDAFNLPGPVVAAAFAFCIHLMREAIKDLEDEVGDASVGISTVAHRIGTRNTLGLATATAIMTVALTIVPWWFGWYGVRYLVMVILLVDLPLLLLLGWAWHNPTERRIGWSRMGLKAGMVAGLVVLLFA